MLFDLIPAEKSALQRQLDADSYRFSRELQLQTDAAFDAAEVSSFEMTGLYGQIPGADHRPLPIQQPATTSSCLTPTQA